MIEMENRTLIDSEWKVIEGQWYDPEVKKDADMYDYELAIGKYED